MPNTTLLPVMQEQISQTPKPLWRLELSPPDPLGARGRLVLFWTLGIVSLLVGLGFFLSGAWPVVGFMGLELLVLYLAFRTMSARQRSREVVELFDNELVVTKADFRGQRRSITLMPSDCHVSLPRPVKWKSTLVLRQAPRHNQPAVSVRLGMFLTPDARAKAADDLHRALKAQS